MTKYKDDAPEKWFIKNHTKIKHELLRLYLVPWGMILRSFNKRLVILDGFAGRGEYTENGKKIICGSPIVFMELNEDLVEELVCVYIEKNRDNYINLCRVLKEKKNHLLSKNPNSNLEIIEVTRQSRNDLDSVIKYLIPKYGKSNRIASNQKTVIFVINSDFQNFIKSVLSYIQRNQTKIAPSFCFIDPFGFHGVPFSIIKEILALPYTEILLTFMARDINRFHPLAQEEKELENLFGTKRWKDQVEKKGEKNFLEFYKKSLKKSGIKFVIYFKMFEEEKRSVIYYLIHASNNLKAVNLMKDQMKKINVDFTYYGPDNNILDNNQLRLTNGQEDFANQLCQRYQGQSITFYKLREETIDENSFVEKEYRSVIKSLEKAKRVSVKRIESIMTGIKDKDIITFQGMDNPPV